MKKCHPHSFHELKLIARNAGKIIMDIYERPFQITHKSDASPLTEADIASDTSIRNSLSRYFPNTPILSEESMIDLSEHTNTFFLVDPLDGTKEFIAKNGEFTVNIAFIENGMPIAAVVYAPAIDELFFAMKGKGAWKEKNNISEQIHVRKLNKASLKIISSRSHQSPELEDFLKNLKYPFTLIETGSSLKFCRIAEGLADLYPRFGPTSQWDTAAGQCILEVSGGMVIETYGDILRYGPEKSILNPFFFAVGDPTLKSYILNDEAKPY